MAFNRRKFKIALRAYEQLLSKIPFIAAFKTEDETTLDDQVQSLQKIEDTVEEAATLPDRFASLNQGLISAFASAANTSDTVLLNKPQ